MGRSPLSEAAAVGDLDRIRQLGSTPEAVNKADGIGWTAFMYACEFAQAGAAQLLLELGAEVNKRGKKGETAAQYAARSGLIPVLEDIAKRAGDAELCVPDARGKTPVHMACVGSVDSLQAKTVQFLLDRGADPLAKMKNGKLPIDLAKTRNLTETIEILSKPERKRPAQDPLPDQQPTKKAAKIENEN